MGISDVIASFIQSALDETDGVLELQRSDLAQRFNCVPSQINYVMSTRFSPEHGYIVESRRGGNGYIRITRVRTDRKTLLMHVINSIGDELTPPVHGPSCRIWWTAKPFPPRRDGLCWPEPATGRCAGWTKAAATCGAAISSSRY